MTQMAATRGVAWSWDGRVFRPRGFRRKAAAWVEMSQSADLRRAPHPTKTIPALLANQKEDSVCGTEGTITVYAQQVL